MKSLLISALLIGVLVIVAYKTMLPKSDPGAFATDAGPPPSSRFVKRCRDVSGQHADPQAYCVCLWQRGMRSMADLLKSASGQSAAAACEAKVGAGRGSGAGTGGR